jgi:hypothetical protein
MPATENYVEISLTCECGHTETIRRSLDDSVDRIGEKEGEDYVYVAPMSISFKWWSLSRPIWGKPICSRCRRKAKMNKRKEETQD